MAQDTYEAAAALVLVRRTNGQTQYVYAGAPAPADAAPGEIDRLLGEGYLRKVGDDSTPAATPGVLDTRGTVGLVAGDGVTAVDPEPVKADDKSARPASTSRRS